MRILRDAATGSWIWAEYRQPIGEADSKLPQISGSNVFKGALLHSEHANPAYSTNAAGHTNRPYLLDFNPTASPNNFRDAALESGKSWADPYSLLTLTVKSAGYRLVREDEA